MDNQTKITNKYSEKVEYRKGRFLREEDAVVWICYCKFGADFKKMAKVLDRSATQCRNRFQVLKQQSVRHTVWSIEEDRKLVQLLSNKNASVNYSSIAKNFPDKDRHRIRSRFITLTKWMKRNHNVDIAKAPRRTAMYLGDTRLSYDLKSALETLKTRIESEVSVKKNKNINIVGLEDEHAKKEEAECHALTRSHDPDEDQDSPQFNHHNCKRPHIKKTLILSKVKLDKNLEKLGPKKNKGILEPDQHLVKKIKSYSGQKTKTNLKVCSAHHHVEENVPKNPPAFAKQDWCAVAIPKLKPKYQGIQHDVIDLVEPTTSNNINLDMEKLFEDSNFDPMKY